MLAIRDPALDLAVRDLADCSLAFDAVPCSDESHPPDQWDGVAVYQFRLRANLSRRDVRDALRRLGFRDVTIADVRRWERSIDEPRLRVARALAFVLGTSSSHFVLCGKCWGAAAVRADPDLARWKEEHVRTRGPLETWLSGIPAEVTTARRSAGLSVRALARQAGVAPEDVVDLERGIVRGVGGNEFLAVLDALGIPTSPPAATA